MKQKEINFIYNNKPFPNFIKDDFFQPDELKVIINMVSQINKVINSYDFDFSDYEHALTDIHTKKLIIKNNNQSLLTKGKSRNKDIYNLPDLKLLRFPEGFTKSLYYKYNNIFLSLLRKINSKKSILYDYTQIAIQTAGKDFTSVIHDDDPGKLLSVVIYICPENNIGTKLFECISEEGWKINNKKVIGPFEVSWKPNRVFIFSRKEGFTPHFYTSNGIDIRHTFVFNLCSNSDPDEIIKSEN